MASSKLEPCEEYVARLKKLEKEYIRVAKEAHHEEGNLEIDDTAKVSFCRDERGVLLGGYVEAWLWVDVEDAPQGVGGKEA